MKALPRRRLIPRWRPVASTLHTKEATSLGKKTASAPAWDANEFDDVVTRWKEHKEPGLLGDVLSFSFHAELREKVIAVGYEAISSGSQVTPVQRILIHELNQTSPDISEELSSVADLSQKIYPFQEPIRRLRALLRVAPDNAFALLDYAQLLTALGKLKAAEKTLRTALSVSPDNRTVLRTIARFYVHQGKPDIAHDIVRRHKRTVGDPWLMASEIALADAAKSSSSQLSKARRLLAESKRFPSAHLTELAGTIAMEEMKAGSLKRAREAQRTALLAPNDNVVAQAVELEQLFGVSLDTPSIRDALLSSSEALTLRAANSTDPAGLITHALAWHQEEPFSSRPIRLLTTQYAYQGDFDIAERWIRAGLLTDPNDSGLLINLAFIQAQLGFEEASRQSIRKLRNFRSIDIEPFVKATEGLIHYRNLLFKEGDVLYREAAALFRSSEKPEMAAFCQLNQALFAEDYSHPQASSIIKEANQALVKNPSPESSMLLKTRLLQENHAETKRASSTRRLTQWVFDPVSNTMTEKPGITTIGAKPVVILDKNK